MFYDLVSTRLDFSDEMETLKVELKKAGKLDDAPKAVASRNRAGLTNWHGLMTLLLLIGNWSQFVPWKLSGSFRRFVKLVLLPSDRCIFIGRGSLRRIQPGHWMHVKASSLPRGAVQRCCNAVATV